MLNSQIVSVLVLLQQYIYIYIYSIQYTSAAGICQNPQCGVPKPLSSSPLAAAAAPPPQQQRHFAAHVAACPRRVVTLVQPEAIL